MASASPLERVAAVLPATIAATLGISEELVYFGRRDQAVKGAIDVVCVDGGWANLSKGGTHARSEQAVTITVRRRSMPEGSRRGSVQAMTGSRATAALVARFTGQRPWPVELPDLHSTRITVVTPDSDPDNVGVSQAVLRLGVLFNGDGFGELGAGQTPHGGDA